MEEKNRVVLPSYSKVWRIERMLYSIGKRRIPPISIKTILYFFFFFMIFSVNIPIIRIIPYRRTILPAGLAYLCSKKLLDGKNPIAWLKSNLIHLLRSVIGSNSVNRYKKIGRSHKARYTTKISYRAVQIIDE